MKKKGFGTRAVHGGRGYVGNTGAVMPPVYMTSTFQQGNPDGFDYTRSGNPNFRLLQESLAALEGAEHATCFASGVSAITAVVSSLKSGDLVFAEENIYGCTYRMFERVFAKFGVQARYADLSRPENWDQIRDAQPKLVWLESPTNPLLKILDIAGICKLGFPVVVDNTFASPCLQRPVELGATLSLSSTTKYINGHSDCLGGIVATNDLTWHKRMLFPKSARPAAVAVRRVADHARRAHARRADGTPLRQRARAGRLAGETEACAVGPVSVPAESPPTQAGPATNERRLRHDHLRPRRRRAGVLPEAGVVHARGESRRR